MPPQQCASRAGSARCRRPKTHRPYGACRRRPANGSASQSLPSTTKIPAGPISTMHAVAPPHRASGGRPAAASPLAGQREQMSGNLPLPFARRFHRRTMCCAACHRSRRSACHHNPTPLRASGFAQPIAEEVAPRMAVRRCEPCAAIERGGSPSATQRHGTSVSHSKRAKPQGCRRPLQRRSKAPVPWPSVRA